MSDIRPSILKAATVLLFGAAPGVTQTPAPVPQATGAQPVPQVQVAAPVLPRTLPNFYRNLIVIDPAHGGPDRGAQLPDGLAEKAVTLAFAQRLRPALVAQGFTVVSTRDSDPTEELDTDQRAGVANHTRPLACLLLHATESGSGIHLATSALEPGQDGARVVHWADAQSGSIAMSLRLSNEIGLALMNARLPAVLLRASVPPVDNLTCAATVIEISPLPADGGRTKVSDAAYQQRVAEAIAQGLASFRTHNAPAPTSAPVAAPAAPVRPVPAPTPAPAAATPIPVKPAVPVERPAAPGAKPAAVPASAPPKPQTAAPQAAAPKGAQR